MKIYQLQYFLDTARLCNFTKAAEKNYISQSAITQQIKALEQELGVELFIRNKRKVELSPAGNAFVGEAEAILTRIEQAKEKVLSVSKGVLGNLRIGFPKGYEASDFPHVIQNFCSNNPSVNISLIRESPANLLDMMNNNELDIIFLVQFDTMLHPELECRVIHKHPLFVTMPHFHPLAYRNSLNRKELAAEAIITNSFSDELEEENSQILQQFLGAGYMPKIIRQEDIDTISIMVSSGIGISIVPEFIAKRWQNEMNLICIPLEGDDEVIFSYAVWEKQNLNPALERFILMLN